MFYINIYKRIGLSLILISFLGLIGIKIYNYYDYQKHSIIIDNIFKNGDFNEFNYVGYIEIDSINVKREILNGITDANLNKNVVTLSSDSGNLDSDNIVLAGHSIENVFGNLKNIKNGAEIKITSFYDTYYYKVDEIKIVNKEDINSLKGDLCLITCMDNPDKRLIVYAKKKISD